jgi:hypothetical protein
MICLGDRVTLSEGVALMQARKSQMTMTAKAVDWVNRQGTVKKLHSNGVHAGVQWEDRRYIDWWPKQKLKVLP